MVWDPTSGNIALSPVAGSDNGIVSLGTATVAVSEYLGHEHAANFWIVHLYDIPTGNELRRFDSNSNLVLLTPTDNAPTR